MNTQDSTNIGFNIHLLSFSFDRYLIKHDVRVITTTYPETKKQEFLIKAKDIQFPNHLLSLNISKDAKLIFIFFQKKCLLTKDPIIGWSVVQTSHFPQDPQSYNYNSSGTICGEVKMLDLYEYSLQEEKKEKDQMFSFNEKSVENIKKTNGQIEIQLTMTEPYIFIDEQKHSKNHKNKNKDKLKNDRINENVKTVNEEDDDPYTPIKSRKSDKKLYRNSLKCSNDYKIFE